MADIVVPRWYQDEAEFSVFDYFQRGKRGNPVVAMPTGTGKSIVIARLIRKLFHWWPHLRIMMLTHVKELIEQNAEKLHAVWATAPMGIYSAGLNSRDMIMPIVFGGVQSVAPAIKRGLEENDGKPQHLKHFGWRDILLIDECHLLSDKEDSGYQYIIAELKKINPNLVVIGFSATPYRMKMGLITENGIFTDICYDITDVASFNRLIAEGYLSPLVARPTRTEIDVSSVGIVGGEFNKKQLEKAADDDDIVFKAVAEMMELAYDRSTWLVFATGIDNTEHVANVIQGYGLDVLPVHSKLPKNVNTERLRAFKAGELRGLVSGQKLTTGFDHPPIDFIGDLNPTLSPGKHVQKYGRGTRPSPATNKQNCLIADFAANIRRLGPINDPQIPNRPGKGGGDAPVRICEVCGVYNHATARQCFNCGTEFTFETKLFGTAGTHEPLRSDAPVIEYFNVNKVIYNLHEKRDSMGNLTKPPMIKVSYFCGLRMFNEYVMLEHSGLAGKRSRDWWRLRHHEDPPPTTYQALQKISELRMPNKLRIHVNLKYPEILSAEW
jgi:DNA repair protein RadD